VPAVLTVKEGESLGRKALSGATVDSFDVLSIPILDVSAARVEVLWANPNTPFPSDYFGADPLPRPAEGTLLARSASAVYINLEVGQQHQIVRFDSREVIIRFE
jgi:hypothetical protein